MLHEYDLKDKKAERLAKDMKKLQLNLIKSKTTSALDTVVTHLEENTKKAAQNIQKDNEDARIKLKIRADAKAAHAAALASHPELAGILGSLKKGGRVRKTGLYKLHAGEQVVPATRVKAVANAVKKAGLKPLQK